jgi:hypothetical protein
MARSCCHKAQTSMISIVIIAGLVISMVSAAYTWAVPMVEKRISITDYNLIENFALELDQEITEIANTGSGSATLEIPKGSVYVSGFAFDGPVNNSITIDFELSQPIMTEGSVPIRTTSLDPVGVYGRAAPRTMILSRSSDEKNTHLNITTTYRELRSSVPRGYVIALCPAGPSDCSGFGFGGNEVRVSYDRTVVVPRTAAEGGDLTVTYIKVEVV